MPPDDTTYSDGFPILTVPPTLGEILAMLENIFIIVSRQLRKQPPLRSLYDPCEVVYFEITKGEEIHFVKMNGCFHCTWVSQGNARDVCAIETIDDIKGWASWIHTELKPRPELLSFLADSIAETQRRFEEETRNRVMNDGLSTGETETPALKKMVNAALIKRRIEEETIRRTLTEKYKQEYGEDPRDWGTFEDDYN